MKNRIKELRLKTGLTLRALGEKVNMSSSRLSQYETGRREPKLETWQKLADFLVCQFLTYKDMQKSIYLMISNLILSKMRLIALKRS